MESQKKNREDLVLARAASMRDAAEACGEASKSIGKMAVASNEEEFNESLRAAAISLSSALSSLGACLSDTREFIKNNQDKGEK